MSRREVMGSVRRQMRHLVEAVAQELKDDIVAEMETSSPSGEVYPVPGTGATYTASAPGEPPAIREGIYRDAWKSTPATDDGRRISAAVVNTRKVDGRSLWEMLEFGTRTMAPRPHIRPVMPKLGPKVRRMIRKLGGG